MCFRRRSRMLMAPLMQDRRQDGSGSLTFQNSDTIANDKIRADVQILLMASHHHQPGRRLQLPFHLELSSPAGLTTSANVPRPWRVVPVDAVRDEGFTYQQEEESSTVKEGTCLQCTGRAWTIPSIHFNKRGRWYLDSGVAHGRDTDASRWSRRSTWWYRMRFEVLKRMSSIRPGLVVNIVDSDPVSTRRASRLGHRRLEAAEAAYEGQPESCSLVD